MSHRARPIVVGLALAVASSTLSAQTFTGADLGGGVGGPRVNSDAAHTAWLAAAMPICPATPETFEGIALGTSSPIALACNMVLTSTGPVGAGFALNEVANDQDSRIGYNTTAGGERFFRFSPDFGVPATMTITFLSPVRAFGAYITGVQQSFGITTATWGANAFILPDTQNPGGLDAGVQFFGFVSPVAINAISFTTVPDVAAGTRDIMGFDDLEVQFTPEPGSVALTLTSLLALGGLAARRRRG